MKQYFLQVEVSSTEDKPLRNILESTTPKVVADWLMDNATILRTIKNEDCV